MNKVINLLNDETTRKKLLNDYNVRIVYKELPNIIDGFVINRNKKNKIYINNDLNENKTIFVIEHILSRIILNKLEKIQENTFIYIKSNIYEDNLDSIIKSKIR